MATANPAIRIGVEVDDLTRSGARPPADVEVAAFRVMQEAVANAARHSGAGTILIAGSVAPEAIDLYVRDDGTGFERDRVADARRSGHFGLDSMRERAAAVGAFTTVAPAHSGVEVRFRWEHKP